ncbi:MAG: hypothetical protein KDA16_11280 [Phycisphaerales bacterium]|nr:hypothetical protein [Phycisphaerales bacterium]
MTSTVVAVVLMCCLCAYAAAQDGRRTVPMVLLGSDEPISAYVREVFQDRDGVYWFGTNGDGLARYDGAELTYITVKDGLGGSAIRGIVQDDDGALWFATDGGVSRYAGGVFRNYTADDGLSAGDVWSIMCDRNGTIWVGTHEGVCRLVGERFAAFSLPRVEVASPESRFSPRVVFAMIEDGEGNLWFGTDGEGVHRYDGESFTSFTAADGLAGNMVRSLCADRHGNVWIGTDGRGVSRYDGASFATFTEANGLSNDRIFEIYEDRAGNLWFSTLGAGACRYDGESFRAFREDPELLISGRPAHSHVQEFFQDRDGVMWFGCSGGLFFLDGEALVHVTKAGPWPERPRFASLENWASETFALPPGFAPDMPSGSESLRFAPGWRTPEAEGFWSYAFVMTIEEAEPDLDRVESLLETYYTGLMSAFAGDRNISAVPVRVELERIGDGRYAGEMNLVDAFATFEPKVLRVMADTAGVSDARSTVAIRVSAQPEGHAIWRMLEAAIADIHASLGADPLARFAHLVGGEWRLGLPGGKWQIDRWVWGPGERSMRSRTFNSQGDGETTCGVWRVMYWHPGRGRIETLNLQWQGMAGTGVIAMEGDATRNDFELFYDEPNPHLRNSAQVRPLVLDWEFEGKDLYRLRLRELERGEMLVLAEWAYARSGELTAMPKSAHEAPAEVRHLEELAGLAGRGWVSGDGLVDGRVDWIAYTEALFARFKIDGGAVEAHVYVHPVTDRVMILALTETGGVYEGEARTDAGGAVVFDVMGYEGDAVVERAIRLDVEDARVGVRVTDREGGVVWEGKMERR